MEDFWVKFFVCLLAGAGAGLGTGFAGMSAATVISPMLVTFLGMDAYQAIGIALASDVLASASSAYTYGKNKNLDIKNGVVMMVTVLIMTIVGSIVATFVPSVAMGNLTIVMTTCLGLKFIISPVTKTRESLEKKSPRARFIQSVVCGIYVGFICGFMGAGGGLMMLFVLTVVLGYELKTAVGTSVFIMIFSALFGAVSHFVIGVQQYDMVIDWLCLGLCIGFTLIFAQIAAFIANKVQAKTLNRLTGIILTILGIVMLIVRFAGK